MERKPSFSFRVKAAWTSFTHPELPFRILANLKQEPEGEPEGLYKAVENVMATSMYGVIRRCRDGTFFSPNEVRRLAGTSPVRTCVLKLAKDVKKTPWNLKGDSKGNIAKVKAFLDKQSMPMLLFTFVQDLLEIDAGVIIKIPSARLKNKLVAISAKDGATFTKELDKYNRLGRVFENISFEINDQMVSHPNFKVGYWQYNLRGGTSPIPFGPEEVVYTMMYPRSQSPYGESPVENIKVFLNTLVRSMTSRLTFYREGMMQSGIMGFEGMDVKEWKRWKEYYDTNIKGQPFKIVQVGTKPFWIPFSASAKDMQFLEEQQWFHQLTYRMFGMPPAVVGALEEVPKATMKEQRENYLRDCLYPVLKTVETAFNVGIIPAILFGMQPTDNIPDVEFQFDLTNEIEQERLLEVHEKELKLGLTTVNRILKARGQDDVAWGEMNVAALPYIQNIAQGYFQGAYSLETVCNILGVPVPKIEDLIGPSLAAKPPIEEPPLPAQAE